MQTSISPLLPLFERERTANRAAVLALATHTEGSTYAKAGGLMLIAADGEFAGLLSGGCLEGDLRAHAAAAVDSRLARRLRYDMRGPDDLLYGLGAGCEGAMDILLVPVGPSTAWRPLAFFVDAAARLEPAAAAFVVESPHAIWPVGSVVQSDGAVCSPDGSLPSASSESAEARALLRAVRAAADARRSDWFEDAALGMRAFIAVLSLPPRLLILGAGPDAIPVAELAAFLGWRTTVVDHRPAFATNERFTRTARVLCAHPDEARERLPFGEFDAAIVMSHHLATDLGWLRLLAASRIPYIGLLGPPARRERLLQDLAGDAAALQGRLRAPVGLDIGGRSPESIALSIVAEIHAALEARPGGPFSDKHLQT